MKILITLLLAVLCAFPSSGTQAMPYSQAQDTWRSVRTNNLFVIGNADPEKLRQVAAWLEFFHSAFGRLVSRNVLESSVPTTVVLFRDDASFLPFKPLYQGRPGKSITGYFQAGDDVNYIAISLDPRLRDPFRTAFHEYVHLHVKDNVPRAPLWLDEGLAELYGSLQFSNGEALIGAPLGGYLRLLRDQELLPLKTLFEITTSSDHYNEDDKAGIFYGQSWAFVHYLMLGDRGRQDQFKRFLQLVSRGDDTAKAIEDSFGMALPMLEQEFRAYVRSGNFSAQRVTGLDPQAYTAYTAMQRTSLSEGEAHYYLGDLLYHIGRASDAERYFKQAVTLEPGFLPAHASLGLMYATQRRYAEAKKYFEKATTSAQSYMTHYLYAYVVSRDSVEADGRIRNFPDESAAVIREHLLRAIKLAPDYSPAYYLLGLVHLVRNENLDEALDMAQKARQLAPSRSGYALLEAQIQISRSDPAAARVILEPLTRDSDQSVRAEAQHFLESLEKGGTRGRPAPARTISSAAIAEPVQASSSRMIGGEMGGGAIRDGQTIEKSGSLPAVDEVLNKYVEAIGGAKAINAVTSRVTKGTVDVAGVSRGGTFETTAQAPNKALTVMQAHPLGTIKVGYNGRTGWTSNVKGVSALKGLELARLQRDADFYSTVRVKNNYAKVTLAGMSKIGFRDVYVLELQPASGPADRLYLDAQTYIPVRLNTVRMTGAVAEPAEIYLDDWREVDGIKYPFSISQRFGKLTLTFTVTEIKHNVAIDASIFEPPKQ